MPLQETSGNATADGYGGGAAAIPNYIEDVFSTYLYTGNGTTNSINNGIDLSTKGGLVWIKSRGIDSHRLTDTARGVNKSLSSNDTTAQFLGTDMLTAFGTAGFTLGADTDSLSINNSGNSCCSWTFRKQPKFFDVVTWTGDGSSTRQITHNLGSTPGFIATKTTSTTSDWYCYHRSLTTPNNYAIRLNLTNAAFDNGVNTWNVTSTTFQVGNTLGNNNSGVTYVAYIFAHNAGGFGLTGTDNVISCGSFTTNASSVFPDVNLGWEPQWILIKSFGSGSWRLQDSMRGMTVSTAAEPTLVANTSAAEDTTSYDFVTPLATGFGQPTGTNPYAASQTFIYIAIRRGPMKVPTDGTKVFKPQVGNAIGVANLTGIGFPPDMALTRSTQGAVNYYAFTDKLRGAGASLFTSTDSEITGLTGLTGWLNDGVSLGADGSQFYINSASYNPWSRLFFRRAPSFFDEVCFTGAASGNQTLNHNLTVAPELIITKSRGSATNWRVYSATTGVDKYLQLNLTGAATTSSGFWPSAPTSTTFSVTPANIGVSTWPAVAYLFATCAGVSKVGSYTGTGTTKQVDCGFAAGARFVLIKRTDSTGDWYVWDTARGMVAGNDPYLLLNGFAAEVTSTDYVDTYAAGFEISSTAPAAINASGGTFIFLAIA